MTHKLQCSKEMCVYNTNLPKCTFSVAMAVIVIKQKQLSSRNAFIKTLSKTPTEVLAV